MTIFYNVIAFLGGLAMFLYGMRVMGDGLKSSSGGAMREALARVTNKPYMGFILGMLVACIIQSSTATIVITVGLVGAGFLTFHQSIGIVLGANVGTAITAQIIRLMDVNSDMGSPLYFFKADNLAPLALVIGIVFIMFIKSNASKTVGSVSCGFGILFMGLIYMSSIVSGFGDSLSGLLIAFQENYFLGFLSGILVTGVVQSSSAVVGIIQSIASSVGVSFSAIFAVIIGVNIGDCITTYLVSSIGARPNQKRTAVVHIVYNVFAALLCFALVFIGRSTGIINDEIWGKTLNSGGVANIHGFFRLVPAVVFLPLTGLFERITCSIVKEEPVDEEDAVALETLNALDERFFNTPTFALDQVDRVVWEMSAVAAHNFDAAFKQIFEYDLKRRDRIIAREDLLDSMTDAANKYVVSLSPHVTIDRDTKRQNYTLKSLICYERIGDLAKNISDEVEALRASGKEFSPTAMEELRIAFDAITEILDITARAYKAKSSTLAAKIEPLEEVIDDLIEEMNARHVYRMVNNLCDALKGIRYQSILTNLEHISDKCSDIAVYILERENKEIFGNEHSYVHELHVNNNDEYKTNYSNSHDKYFNALEAIPVVSETIVDIDEQNSEDIKKTEAKVRKAEEKEKKAEAKAEAKVKKAEAKAEAKAARDTARLKKADLKAKQAEEKNANVK